MLHVRIPGPAAPGPVTTSAPSTRKMASIKWGCIRGRGRCPGQVVSPSTRGRERRFEPVGEFDVDFERRNVLAPVQPDSDLVRIERDVPRDHRKDFLAEERSKSGWPRKPRSCARRICSLSRATGAEPSGG